MLPDAFGSSVCDFWKPENDWRYGRPARRHPPIEYLVMYEEKNLALCTSCAWNTSRMSICFFT